MRDVSAGILLLEDRAAIQDLVVRYCLAADSDDLEELRRLFADDITFCVSGQVGGRGRDAVIQFLVNERKKMGLTLHTPDYVLIKDIDGDRAAGVAGAHLEIVLEGKAHFGAVRYVDEYLRVNGAWVIRNRDMRCIYLAPWNEVASALASDRPVRWPGMQPSPSDFPRKG